MANVAGADRLAGKWNFNIPGLPESVEVHVGRLGQTGEHVGWADGIPRRSVQVQRAQYVFRVASAGRPADDFHIAAHVPALLFSALRYRGQCTIAGKLKCGLHSPADIFRVIWIWKGVATYLVLVSDYVKRFRGEAVALPPTVRASATFGGEKLTFARDFLRIPIVPESVSLYTTELRTLAQHGELKANPPPQFAAVSCSGRSGWAKAHGKR